MSQRRETFKQSAYGNGAVKFGEEMRIRVGSTKALWDSSLSTVPVGNFPSSTSSILFQVSESMSLTLSP
jgi:hypothetical protein